MVPCVRKVNEILNSFEWQKVERNVFRPKLDFLNDRSPHRSVSNHIHRIVPFFHSMFNWTHRSVVNHSTFYFYLHVVSLLIFATTFVSAIVLFTHVGSAFFSLAFCLFRYFLYISDVYMPVFFFVVVFFSSLAQWPLFTPVLCPKWAESLQGIERLAQANEAPSRIAFKITIIIICGNM